MDGLKFPGVKVFMNGQDYVVPSLSLSQVRDNYETLTAPVGGVETETMPEQAKRFIPLIGMALRRNYPEVSDETLWGWVDITNFVPLILAVRGASGLVSEAPGEV